MDAAQGSSSNQGGIDLGTSSNSITFRARYSSKIRPISNCRQRRCQLTSKKVKISNELKIQGNEIHSFIWEHLGKVSWIRSTHTLCPQYPCSEGETNNISIYFQINETPSPSPKCKQTCKQDYFRHLSIVSTACL